MVLPRMAVDLIANAVRCTRRATDQSFVPLAGVLLNSEHWFVGRPHEGLDTHEHGLVLDPENPIIHGPEKGRMIGLNHHLVGRGALPALGSSATGVALRLGSPR